MCRRIIILERVSALLTPGRTRAERPASFSRRARRASQALPRARSETKRSEGRAKRKLGSGEQGKSGRRRSRLPRDPRHVTRGYTFRCESDILPVYIRVCRYLKKFDIWKKVELLKMFFLRKGKCILWSLTSKGMACTSIETVGMWVSMRFKKAERTGGKRVGKRWKRNYIFSTIYPCVIHTFFAFGHRYPYIHGL